MPLTLAQIITNQLFQKAVTEASVKKNAFIQSGVAAEDVTIAGVLKAGGTYAEGQSINMNFVRRWKATAQMPGTIANPVVPDGTSMGQDAAPFILRDFAFGAETFAGGNVLQPDWSHQLQQGCKGYARHPAILQRPSGHR